LTSNHIGYITFTTTAFILGLAFGATSEQNSWRLDAAATSCAQFNPAHGQFEWLEKSE
jgi:hypothetical protein